MSTTTSTKSQRINPVSIGMAFLIFAVICLLIGGFFDYQISKNVAGLDEHKWDESFGNYFSFIPGTLCSMLIAFVGSCLVISQPHNFKKVSSKLIYLVLAYLLVGALVWFQCYDGMIREIFYSFHLNKAYPSNQPTGNFGVLYALAVAICFMGASCFMIHYKLGQHKKTLFKWCLFAFLVIAIQWLIVTTCKSNLPRERFFHLKNNEGNFRPWYSLIWNKSNGSGFAYSSFPSGHTNWAIALILLCPLVYVISPKKPWLTITTTIFVAIIVITTMFARIQAARHYLSDTAMSVFISATCSTSIYLLFYKWNKFSVN